MKKNKGITLIALVITVIIIIILAALTINLAIGNNGVVEKSKDAADETKIAQIDEEISFMWASLMMDRSFSDLTVARKAEVLEEKLKEKDSDATVTVTDAEKGELTVEYKGIEKKITAGTKGTSTNYTGNNNGNSGNSGSGNNGENGSAENGNTGGNNGGNTGGNSNVNENKVTVTFNTNGGSQIASVQIDKGTRIDQPATNPTKAENDFVAWYADEELTTLFDFSQWLNENTTIYAKWLSVGEYYSYTVSNYEVTITGFSELGLERYNAGLLTDLQLPSTYDEMPVTKIANNAFKNKTNITGITFSNSIQTIGAHAFEECTGLTELSIPSNVKTLAYASFKGCSGLTRVEITCDTAHYPASFYGCTNIANVKIKPGTTTVMKNAGTGNLADEHSMYGGPWYDAKAGVIVEIEDGITQIGNNSFYKATKVGKIIIPSSVTTIGNYVFYEMTQITKQTRTATNELYAITIPDTVTTIGNYLFYKCTNLASYEVPKAMIDSKKINNGTYYGTKITTLLGVPNDIETIGDYAFYGCNEITTLVIPNGVKTIRTYAFSRCTNITELDLTSNVQTIGEHAFEECTGMTELSIPSNVKTLAYASFKGCSGLTRVEITCDTAHYPASFYGCTNIANVKIKPGTTTVMKNAGTGNLADEHSMYGGPWYDAKAGVIVEIEDGITQIGNNSFYKATKVGKIIIPSSVTEIGNYVFYDVSDSLVINYKGTSEQWTAITKGTNNDKLSTVTINYNYSGSGGE